LKTPTSIGKRLLRAFCALKNQDTGTWLLSMPLSVSEGARMR